MKNHGKSNGKNSGPNKAKRSCGPFAQAVLVGVIAANLALAPLPASGQQQPDQQQPSSRPTVVAAPAKA